MSFISDFGKRMIKARQRHANEQVCAILSSMDDATLKRAGIKREELENRYW